MFAIKGGHLNTARKCNILLSFPAVFHISSWSITLTLPIQLINVVHCVSSFFTVGDQSVNEKNVKAFGEVLCFLEKNRMVFQDIIGGF